MNNKCDVHILKFNRNDEWYQQCLDSLKDEPINLHIIEGIKGDIGRSRFKGFHLGSAEYVSYVDDDDYIEPGAYQHCLDLLNQHPEAVGISTRERWFWEDGRIRDSLPRTEPTDNSKIALLQNDFRFIHHIIIMRREPVLRMLLKIPFIEENTYYERYLVQLLYQEGYHFIFTNEIMYYYRQHAEQATKMKMDL